MFILFTSCTLKVQHARITRKNQEAAAAVMIFISIPVIFLYNCQNIDEACNFQDFHDHFIDIGDLHLTLVIHDLLR